MVEVDRGLSYDQFSGMFWDCRVSWRKTISGWNDSTRLDVLPSLRELMFQLRSLMVICLEWFGVIWGLGDFGDLGGFGWGCW